MARTPDLAKSLRWSIVVIMGLVCAWAIIDVARSYPSNFYPRFWDEAAYVTDVMTPGALWEPDAGNFHYSSAKLGYGIPLSAATSIFGDRGAMYLSTALWLLTIAAVGWTAWRRFGAIAGACAAAFLAYSPLFGKYVTEAGPTLLAAFCFVLLWILYRFKRPWLTGLAVGLLAFVDFKWAAPAGLAIVLIEFLVMRQRPVARRLVSIAAIGGTAIAGLGVAGLLHPAYGDFLKSYVLNHTGIIQFEPSGVFLFYLWVFGAAPAVIAAVLGMTWCDLRRHLSDLGSAAGREFFVVVLLCGIPILFYSLVSTLKALRFFAIVFPLFAVIVGVAISTIVAWVAPFLRRRHVALAKTTAIGLAIALAALIVVGSDGPARHLRLPTGVPQALEMLADAHGKTGTVSSYIWPVVQYGWEYPTPIAPFAMWGLLSSDQWLLLDPMADRVTIDSRLILQPVQDMTADSLWTMRSFLTSHLEPVLSTASTFYASDYFLCESTAGGIPILRQWQSLRGYQPDSLTIYKVDLTRLQPAPDGN